MKGPSQSTDAEHAAVAAGPENRQGPTVLRRKMIRGSLWTVGGYGFSQAFRLGSNLVLSRLLFPEAFGVMALVNVYMQGLQMFSDVGIGPSIIQNERGEDPAFLNTAWTIQVIRGAALWIGSWILAWPLALLYGEPILARMIPVAGIAALIAGFGSTSLFTLNRNLLLGKLTLLDLGTSAIGSVTMIVWAYVHPSIWALLAGGLTGSLARTVCSHWLQPGQRNRFQWEPRAARALLRFGRWILISTALTFLVSRGDRMIMGVFLTVGQLGVYSIAFGLSQVVLAALDGLSGRMLFPVYSRLAGASPEEMRSKLRRTRIVILAVALPFFSILVAWGGRIVDFLYDSRYHDAGWILQILAAGTIFRAITTTFEPVTLAFGDSFRQMLKVAMWLVLLIAAMAVGGWLGGMRGLIIGVACTDVLRYPVTVWATQRYGGWMPALDLAAVAYSGVFIGILMLPMWL
ncbi:MAG TPA: oligosaccharide flippase family protein [Planctomycetota bacterium]|nr:oligosaccharide flippase family protein [Planctomycetota bacterium]